MNQVEQRKAAKAFAAFWQGRGDEVSDTQPFWLSLLRDVLGEGHPEQVIQFEKRVKLQNTAFIDACLPSTRVLIEQKSLAKSLTEKILQSDSANPTPDGLRIICVANENDPEKNGIPMLEMLAKFRNEGIAH